MAATGLPIPKVGTEITQPIGVGDMDRLSTARSWQMIAQAGSEIEKDALSTIRYDVHQLRVGATAASDSEARRRRLEISYEVRDSEDPVKEFDKRWSAYESGKLSAMDPRFVPHARTNMNTERVNGVQTLMAERYAVEKKIAHDSWTAQLDMRHNDLLALANAGTDPGSAEYVAAQEAYKGVAAAGVTSKFIAPEEYQRRVNNLASEAQVYNAQGEVKKRYGDGNTADANKYIDDLTRDPKLSLSIEKRRGLNAYLKAGVHAMDAERTANLDPVKLEAEALADSESKGVRIGQTRQDEVVAKYQRYGAHKEAADWVQRMRLTREVSITAGQNVAQQAANVDLMRNRAGISADAGPRVSQAMDVLQKAGLSHAAAAGVIGNFLHESGLKPTALHDFEGGVPTGLGIAGWRNERRTALYNFARANGASPTDYETQLNFFVHELQTSTDPGIVRAREGLARARTPEEAAAAMLHFERPQGYTPGDVTQSLGYNSRLSHARQVGSGMVGAPPTGQVERGNIDIFKLPAARGEDGKATAMMPISVNIDGKEVLIPTVSPAGTVMTQDEAITEYKSTGKHLGVFDTPASAAAYAKSLSAAQEARLNAPARAPVEIRAASTATVNARNALNTELNSVITGMLKNDVMPTEQRMVDLMSLASAVGDDGQALAMYNSTAALVQMKRRLGTIPPGPLSAEIEKMKQAAAGGGLEANDARKLEIAETVLKETTKGLNDDPYKFAVRANSENMKIPDALPPISDRPSFTAAMAQRADQARTLGYLYRTGLTAFNMPAISNEDATQIKSYLDGATGTERARVFQDIATAIPDERTRMATFAKLGQEGPKAMVLSFTGALHSVDPRAGNMILDGQDARKVNTKFMPTKDETLQGDLNTLLPPTAFNRASISNVTGQYATMRSAVLDAYAGLSSSDGDVSGEYKAERLTAAINLVTGGMVTHNGKPIITPYRGASQSTFDGLMQSVKDSDLAGVTTVSGTPLTADYIRRKAQLESFGEGRYLVRIATGDNPYAITGATAGMGFEPFVLDLRGRKPSTTVPDNEYR